MVAEHPGIPLRYLARVLSPDEPTAEPDNPFELPRISLTENVRQPWRRSKQLLSPPPMGPHLNRILPYRVQQVLRDLEHQAVVWGWTHSDPPAVLTNP